MNKGSSMGDANILNGMPETRNNSLLILMFLPGMAKPASYTSSAGIASKRSKPEVPILL
jgi:hypothetical protein